MEKKNNKKYVRELANFLFDHNMVMSSEELAGHLNRNRFFTTYGQIYSGGRGTFKLIKETWNWVNNELGLKSEGHKIARAFVKPNGAYAYE